MIMHPVPIKEPCRPHQPSAQVKPCEQLGVIGGGLRLGTTTPSICMEFRTRKKVIHCGKGTKRSCTVPRSDQFDAVE
jgi:hypothetical protein